MPYCIGLTGGIGSGKSTVAEMFRALGAGIVDTDAISHALTATGAPGHRAIIEAFGPAYAREDGSLDRARLRQQIFSDTQAKARLEAILHPMIRARVNEEIQQKSAAPYVLVVVPLLVETGAYGDIVQRVLVVDCSEEDQLRRTMTRSHLSEAEARAIMARQASRAQRREAADDVITNQEGLDALRTQVGTLDQRYRQLGRDAKAKI